ncbi:MAG: RNA polymerase sigma factor [Steroidobacteraceae bacterium]
MSRFLAIEVDGDCLRRAAAGERAAQQEVYERTAGPAFALIRRIVRSRPAAEDVFQDCMLRLLGALPGFRGEAPFGAWARQVVLRACLMHLRSPWQRGRRALLGFSLDEDAADPLEPAARETPLGAQIDLERALARLPQTARAIVWMHDVEGLRHEEIAAAFGRSVSFSKSQLSRAHAQLRMQLQAYTRTACATTPGMVIEGPSP